MLTKLILRNFKSFKDVEIDLSSTAKSVKNLVAIYGENGSGKSNLISAISFLLNSMKSLSINELLNNIVGKNDLVYDEVKNIFELNQKIRSIDLNEIKMIGSNENMYLEYHFLSNSKNTIYSMEFDNEGIVKETLSYPLLKNMIEVFSISKDKIVISPSFFLDPLYKNDLDNQISKYFGKHTFMAILNKELEDKNIKYIKDKINNSFFDVFDELNKCSVSCKNPGLDDEISAFNQYLVEDLDVGVIEKTLENTKRLKISQEVLNEFFTSLYSDIKSVEYMITEKDDRLTYKLHFKKMIGEEIRIVPYDMESTGTIKLLNIFKLLYQAVAGNTVFIDEIDTGVHDLLMLDIIRSINKSIKGQLIFTTHNTMLMDELKADSSYIISVDLMGNKKVDCVSSYEKIQKNHSVNSRYIKGLYGGIPMTGYLDFDSIIAEMRDDTDE